MTSDRVAGLRPALVFLSLSRLVMNTSYRFVYPFLPAIARGLGIPLTTAGLLVSARSLAGLATPLVVATAGRTEGRRRLLGLGLIMFAAGTLLTAALGTLAGAFAGFVLIGIAKPVFDLAAQAYLSDRTPYSRRARYLSILELTWAGSLLVGAPVAGWLIRSSGWATPFWLFGGLAVLALFATPIAIDADTRGQRSLGLRAGMTRSGMVLLGVIFLFSFAAENSFVVFGAWLEDRFSLSLVALGGAATLVAVAELTGEGATLAFTDRLGKRRAVALGLGLSIVGFMALGLVAESLAMGLTVFAATFAAFELTVVSSIPLATEAVPTNRAAYLAWMMVAVSIARSAGAATGPFLFEWGGFAANTTLSAGADIIALAALLRLVHEDDDHVTATHP